MTLADLLIKEMETGLRRPKRSGLYVLVCIKQMTSENRMYSSGNLAQCSVYMYS